MRKTFDNTSTGPVI